MRTTRFLAVGVIGMLALAACGSGGSSKSGSGGLYGNSSPSTTAKKAASTPGATVSVATGGAGAHLVGPNQHTLYIFDKDQGTTTGCTGGCVSVWPPLVATGTATGGDGVDAGALSTADGSKPNQVTYHGHLLYSFSGDAAAGDMNGTSIPFWHAVAPDGSPLPG